MVPLCAAVVQKCAAVAAIAPLRCGLTKVMRAILHPFSASYGAHWQRFRRVLAKRWDDACYMVRVTVSREWDLTTVLVAFFGASVTIIATAWLPFSVSLPAVCLSEIGASAQRWDAEA